MTRIYLIRHTKVALDRGYFYGRSDVALADSFADEASRIKGLLPRREAMPVWSSPLSRCRLLAEELFPAFELDDRLLELDFGDWEMKAFSEVPDAAREHYLSNFDRVSPPNGERFLDLQARAVHLLDDVLEKELPEAAIVAHSGVIRSLLCHVMDVPLSRLYRFDVDYGSVSTLVRDSKSLRVHRVNQ